ncbi:MAG TPA: hypothetical protein VI653_10990 [Steroidobacteraceae bacterium]
MKLSRIPRSAATVACLGVVAVVLGACSSTPPQPVVDRLDPDTATTVTVLKKPVELVAESLHSAGGDPFAFIAPFETDRMGQRAQYLWMSAPGVENAKIEPQLMCDGQALQLSPVDGDIGHLGLAHPPYEKPAPWSRQWYFQLPPETLRCLSDAQRVTLETRADSGQSEQFTVEAKGLSTLKAFGSH